MINTSSAFFLNKSIVYPQNKVALRDCSAANRVFTAERLLRYIVQHSGVLMFASIPIATIQAAVLHGFRQMFGSDGFRAAQICDGAGYFEYPVVRSGAEAHAADCHFERPLARFIKSAEFA